MSSRLSVGARAWPRRPRVSAILGATVLAVWVSGHAVLAYATLPMEDASPALGRGFTERAIVVYLHVFGASLAPVLGLAQVSSPGRRRWPRAHRWIGYFYLGVCVFLGGVAGLWLAMFAAGGLAARLGFGALGVAWLTTGAMALARICDRDVEGHRAWICRNFALTWGAVMLRVYMGVAQQLLGLSFEQAYPVVAWLAWVPNLIVAEWVVARNQEHRLRP